MDDTDETGSYCAALTTEFVTRYGELMTGIPLYRSLGFQSSEAFRQAKKRKTVPIRTFRLPQRRGHFALTRDIASWLSAKRLELDANESEDESQGANPGRLPMGTKLAGRFKERQMDD